MSLRYAILALITHQELSGYEITRRFEESVGYFWHARSQAFIGSDLFQALTWARIVGGALFVLGGVLPLAWFVVTRAAALKAPRPEPAEDAATRTAPGADALPLAEGPRA